MNNINLIGIDFSINKPCICILKDNKYSFFGFPYGMKETYKSLFKENGVSIIDRLDDKLKGDNISSKLRYEVNNAKYLSTLIFDTIKSNIDFSKETYIAYEGLSYGSSGDVVLQLGGYKFVLMDKLSSIIPLDNMYTYSPISIKKTAGCSKKGMNKKDMIHSFLNLSLNNKFHESLKNKRDLFMKKGMLNWIEFVDDCIDAFWTLETLRDRECL